LKNFIGVILRKLNRCVKLKSMKGTLK